MAIYAIVGPIAHWAIMKAEDRLYQVKQSFTSNTEASTHNGIAEIQLGYVRHALHSASQGGIWSEYRQIPLAVTSIRSKAGSRACGLTNEMILVRVVSKFFVVSLLRSIPFWKRKVEDEAILEKAELPRSRRKASFPSLILHMESRGLKEEDTTQ
jgi:hypothetical protein